LLLAPGQTWGGVALESADWRRCQLAVLAACSTAFGEQEGKANPGTVARHLLRGGAARVLAARWAIDSEVTERLLKSFYTKVLEGQSASAALAGALGELPDRAHPFFWGGFELFGQP
jgi:CHAT domain-containing protein